ncbi:lysoplasmalogenase family protein [Pseudoxanthomonas sp. GW2]|uniref:lysoplasmalogenase n=2 Tax=unclassified Pseudoxanthomonas TaxID=2645906 RepID=UPI00037BC924
MAPPIAQDRQLMDPRFRATGAAVAILAAGAIAGALLDDGFRLLHYACKPLATVLIAVYAMRAAPPVSARYRAAVLAGLACSLAGDVFLMLPQDLFVPGLVAFLLAHLCYIVAFFPGAGTVPRVLGLLAYMAFAGCNLVLLLPSVPAALRVAVLVYVGVLMLMAGLATARAWSLRHDRRLAAPARAAALGGMLFVLSDSLLAWDRFGGGLPLAMLFILATYYAAQWCIAHSVAPSGRAPA